MVSIFVTNIAKYAQAASNNDAENAAYRKIFGFCC